MDIMLDASAIIAVIADEPESQIVINYTQGATLVSPVILSFEVANAISRMMRKNIINSMKQMIDLIRNYKKIPIKTVNIDLEKALEISWRYKIYAYDAFYLEAAKRLQLPFITFDIGMKKIGRELGIDIIGE